jgi:hypothetical protein
MVLKIENKIESIEICSNQEHDVTRINSIKSLYKEVRQESKSPTFALT